MTNQLRLSHVLAAAVCAFAGAGACSSRNLIGDTDGGSGKGGPMGSAGTGLGFAGDGVNPGLGGGGGQVSGIAGTGAAGIGAAGVNPFAGIGGIAGAIGTGGTSATCKPGLYVPPPPEPVNTGFAGTGGGAGASGGFVDVAVPTSSTPLAVATPVDYPVGQAPSSLAAGDLDGDGKIDLVVGAYAGTKVLLNKGGGAFLAATSYATAGAVALGDLSGDGKPDLVVAASQDVWVLVNDGKGAFPLPIAPVNRTRGKSLGFPAVGDLDGDGKQDIVVTDNTGNGFVTDPSVATVLLNEGGGKFAMPMSAPVGNFPSGLVLADVDSDHCVDVVVSNILDNSVTIASGSCDGRLMAPQSWRTGGRVTGVAVGPLAAGAAVSDIVASLQFPADVNVFLADSAQHGFSPAARYNAGAGTMSVALADMDADGDLDAVVGLVGGIGVLLNKGDRTFAAPLTALSPCGTEGQLDAVPIALADFDGDGRPDIAATSSARGVVTVYLNRLK